MDIIVDYLLFIGAGLYLVSTGLFFYLFLKTLRSRDGIGLTFLRFLTLGISIASFTVFIIRVLSEYGNLSFLMARAIAVVNPTVLVAVGLYLNFLFHNPSRKLESTDSKNISDIKNDVKEVKKDVKVVKHKI